MWQCYDPSFRLVRRSGDAISRIQEFGEYFRHRRLFRDFPSIPEMTAATKDLDSCFSHFDLTANISHGAIGEGCRVSFLLYSKVYYVRVDKLAIEYAGGSVGIPEEFAAGP